MIPEGAIQSLLRQSEDRKASLCCFGNSKGSSVLHLTWFGLVVFKFHPCWCDFTVLSSQICTFFEYLISPLNILCFSYDLVFC